MNHTPITYFNGVDKDNPARIIPENRCSDASNIMFEDMLVKSRFGYQLFADIDDPVMAIIFYERPYTNYTNYLVAATTRDLYAFNQSSGVMQIKTPCYTTGTVSVALAAPTTVVGNATAWTGITFSDPAYWQIGFGTTDPDAVTTWHDIASRTDATHLVLATALTATQPSTTYVLRLRMSGTVDDNVFYTMPYDDSISDKCLLVTNGIDNILYWSGSGYFTELVDRAAMTCTIPAAGTAVTTADTSDLITGMTVTGTYIAAGTTITVVNATDITLSQNSTATAISSAYLTFTGTKPNKAKHIAYFGSVGFEHTITSNVNESGNQRPMTIELSNGGTIVWRDIFYDLLNTEDQLQGVESLQNKLIFYKTNSISEAWMTGGGNADPLDFIQNKVNIGTMAMRTVCNIENYHIFASLQGIYAYDGNSAVPIGQGIVKHYLSNLSKPNASRSFAFTIKRLNLYCLFVASGSDATDYPDIGYIYNYVDKSWSIWEFNDPIYCFGKWKKTEAPTYAQIRAITPTAPTWADYALTTSRWRDFIIQDDDETFLLGDVNGLLHEFGETYLTDNGTNIVSTFTTRDYPLNDQKHAVRLAELVLGFRDQNAGQIQVRASVDFGEEWCDYILVDMNSPNTYYEEIVNFIMRGVQVRFQILNYLGSSFSIENMIIGWNNMGVKR